MKTTVEIKSISGNVLFSYESEDNSIRKTLEKAVKVGADLSGAYLKEVNLSEAYLREVDLSGAYLVGANLSGANLVEANFSGADLRKANLRKAYLSGANFLGTYLSGANFLRANLSGVNLSGANLSEVNLSGANLSGANLSRAKYDETTSFLLSQCPSEGSFVAWKKASEYVVKLRVTENAKRSSATTLKCRCSEAEVLDIQDLEGNSAKIKEVKSNHDSSFVYRVGEIVKVDDFDENRWNECSTGIHFFISREIAVKYN